MDRATPGRCDRGSGGATPHKIRYSSGNTCRTTAGQLARARATLLPRGPRYAATASAHSMSPRRESYGRTPNLGAAPDDHSDETLPPLRGVRGVCGAARRAAEEAPPPRARRRGTSSSHRATWPIASMHGSTVNHQATFSGNGGLSSNVNSNCTDAMACATSSGSWRGAPSRRQPARHCKLAAAHSTSGPSSRYDTSAAVQLASALCERNGPNSSCSNKSRATNGRSASAEPSTIEAPAYTA